jgi:murein L,D-transpeptidase YcbB/YkuD
MRTIRLHRLLAATAVATTLPLAMALTASAQDRPTPSAADVEAGIPVPDFPDLPPLTIKDIAGAAQPNQTVQLGNKATLPNKDIAGAGQAGDVTDANAAVADKLRELASGHFDRIIDRRDRNEVAAFYKARDYAPLWINKGALDAHATAAAKYLAGVAADGLDPADYPVPAVKMGADADALATAEIKLTNSVLDFARHAQTGRIHYSRISADISYNLDRPDPADVLGKLAKAQDVGAALDSFNPQQPGYKALKAALAKARSNAPEEKPEVVHIAGGHILRPGVSDPRVIDLRKRLGITADPTSDVYDDTVVAAVKSFQKENDLGTDGMVGPGTLRVLNGNHYPSADRASIIIANMERWRWLPHDLGRTYVMVNIPDYTLHVVHDGKEVWSTKIVVGKPNKRTPLISASMKYITVNPTWNVPPSIIRNEYLPVIQQDPSALERTGLKMEQNPDGTIRIFQPPGDRNALGRIRFNFPNKFLVYQHDTPDKYLFARFPRAYSHGCMRVQDPLKYGEVLLSLVLPNEHYTVERLHHMYGGSEVNINFPKAIPVHLTYQTAFVDDNGKLVLRDDVYGYDADILSVLHGPQHKVADIPIERPKSASSQPVMMPPGLMARNGGGRDYNDGPGGFFERLFGGPDERYAPPPRDVPRRRAYRGGGFFN